MDHFKFNRGFKKKKKKSWVLFLLLGTLSPIYAKMALSCGDFGEFKTSPIPQD